MLEAGIPAGQILLTTPHQTGAGLARRAMEAGAHRVMVAGGDGTVRVVAGVLAGTDVALGIIPTGTANLAARNLAVPRRREAALEVALRGRPRAVDIGWASLDGGDAQPFLMVTGMGNDAVAVAATGDRLKRVAGWWSYFGAGASLLRSPGAAMAVDGDEPEATWSILVANNGRLPLRAAIAPGARPDDGLLHALQVRLASPWQWRHVASAGLRRRDGPPDVLRRRVGTAFTISAAEPQPVQLDGDALGEARQVQLRVQPRALHVLSST